MQLTQLAGLALATTGAAHFAAPQVFLKITEPAFPDDSIRHVHINGTLETVLGLALLRPGTRPWAAAGLVAYATYIALAAARHR